MYTMKYLSMFDVVMAHAFEMFKSHQDGAVLPPFMETDMYEKAKNYTLELHRKGVLVPMYNRIERGAI